MPTSGFNPCPFRCGGRSRIAPLYRSINAGRGDAYDTSDDSNVTAETMAEARALAVLWSASRRLSLQWDPRKMTDMLPRWEKIFGIVPGATDTLVARRNRLVVKFKALAGPLASTVSDAAQQLLGDSYVGIEYTPLASATIAWPGNGSASAWYSTVAHVVVRTQQTSTQTRAEFIQLMGELMRVLGDMLPAWVTYDWAVYNSGGTNGFLLDEYNLDAQTFD